MFGGVYLILMCLSESVDEKFSKDIVAYSILKDTPPHPPTHTEFMSSFINNPFVLENIVFIDSIFQMTLIKQY